MGGWIPCPALHMSIAAYFLAGQESSPQRHIFAHTTALLPRISLPRTPVNRAAHAAKHQLASVSSGKYSPFGGCAVAPKPLRCNLQGSANEG
jgi:hypothetical protein